MSNLRYPNNPKNWFLAAPSSCQMASRSLHSDEAMHAFPFDRFWYIIRTIRILGLWRRGAVALFIFLWGCSGFEQSEKEKIRRQNSKGECIYRNASDVFAPIPFPLHTPRAAYPWEHEVHLSRITKDFFRCKGSSGNPSYVMTVEGKPLPLSDCEGYTRHGLPLIGGQENVYPGLIELLNYLQRKTGHRVIITCGHRCPAHNTYSDPSKDNKSSKHQLGAEVDFYIQGMEDQPLEVVSLLMQYYKEHDSFKNFPEWAVFQRYEKQDSRVVTPPWFNKEIFVKYYQKQEGRDLDNRHPYPYLSIQVRYDRDKKERVLFDWEKAFRGYPKK